MNEEEMEKLYSKVSWGRPGPVVTAAFIVRIPLDKVADLEAALAVMGEVKVVFRRVAVGHLYITGNGPDAPADDIQGDEENAERKSCPEEGPEDRGSG